MDICRRVLQTEIASVNYIHLLDLAEEQLRKMQLYIYPLAGSATIPVQRSNQLSYDSGAAL